MINVPKSPFLRFTPLYPPPRFRSLSQCVSSLSSKYPLTTLFHHLTSFFQERLPHHPPPEFSLVSALKSCSSISQAQQIQPLVVKSGLTCNIYVQNSILNLYAKHGHIATAHRMFDSFHSLDVASWNIMVVGYVKLGLVNEAKKLFDEMPERDCISYTTMIMGFAQNDLPVDAVEVFGEMRTCGVAPNEVTLATVISACVNLQAKWCGEIVHGITIRSGFEAFVLVSTNLVHLYVAYASLSEAELIFNGMAEQNVVTWNVMLNGYSKCGLIDSAKDLFERIPMKDLVSWSTMIDGYVRADRLREALGTYRQMLCSGVRPNEVTIVDLLSACGRFSVSIEGWQFHGVILKLGLDCHVFVQTTLIHFYAACEHIHEANLQFQFSNRESLSPWNALIDGFSKNNMVDSARLLFDKMPVRDVVSWSSMIAGYVQSQQFDLALELFQEMQDRGLKPNEITMVSVVSAIARSGMLKWGKWVHNYILENFIPLNENLSAGLIDMYAKCGSIEKASELFYRIKDKIITISPWNAIICGLAMHGHADMSLNLFFDLLKTGIKPNSITFIGVLSACCHAGLVQTGKRYFERMKTLYNIEPNLKHYGCMVDLLGRAGCVEEAERLIERMPMEADVVIWGSMLAACRTHGNVDIGERAAESLARLEPSHGAGRVMLSNIYAEAERWNEVLLVRRDMQRKKVKKLPGCSGVL